MMVPSHGEFSSTGSRGMEKDLRQTKKFYSTALKWQESNKLSNGASQQEYLKRAFAFVQYIMPNLAQKFEASDASEYILALMPDELYEAGQRAASNTPQRWWAASSTTSTSSGSAVRRCSRNKRHLGRSRPSSRTTRSAATTLGSWPWLCGRRGSAVGSAGH